MSQIRKIEKQDIDALEIVIESTGLFPGDLLQDMMNDYLTNPSTEEIWLTKDVNGMPVTIAFCAPEKFTEGTYNLFLIAVHKKHQGNGIGSEMMSYIEESLRARGERVLIVETSGLPDFDQTRKFYDHCKFERTAVIRDFYKEGDDKIIFWKKLNAAKRV